MESQKALKLVNEDQWNGPLHTYPHEIQQVNENIVQSKATCYTYDAYTPIQGDKDILPPGVYQQKRLELENAV